MAKDVVLSIPMVMFSVFDSMASSYSPPMAFRTNGEAMRFFEDLCRKPEGNVYKHPSDFSLYRIGGFDAASGSITGGKLQHLCNAVDYTPAEGGTLRADLDLSVPVSS